MSSWNFVLSWVEHEKSFITSGPDQADHLANLCTDKNFVKDDVTRATVKSYKPAYKSHLNVLQTILQILFKKTCT